MSARRPTPGGLGRLAQWRDGVVSFFDGERGLGEIEEAGGERLGFHCVAITDGTRQIAPGTPVRYRAGLGPTGVLEARAVTKMAR